MIDRLVRRVRTDPMAYYALAVVLAFVAVTLGPALLGFRTLISVNMLTGYMPWRAGGLHSIGHQGCTGDTIDAEMPSIAWIRNSWWGGHLGTWQNLVGGGSQRAGLPNAGMLNPLSLPYIVLPLWLAPAFVKLLEFTAAIGGMFLFLRRLGVSRAAGLMAGVLFASSGFMIMWTNWPQTRVAAWIPLLLWSVERLVQRRRAADVAWIALILASMLLGGFPAVTGYALYLAGLYLVFRVVQLYRSELREAGRVIAYGAGAVVIGATVSAVQMLPFASYYTNSDFSYRSSRSLRYSHLSSLITMVAPESQGLCVGGTPRHGQIPIEAVAFVGCAGVLLAVGGAVMLRRKGTVAAGVPAFFAVATIVVLLLGWGRTPLLVAVHNLPVFAGNFIGRIRSILGFVVAVLAGFGFDALVRRRERLSVRPSRDWLRPSAGVVRATVLWAAAVVLGIFIVWKEHDQATRGHYWPDVRHNLVLPAVLFLISVVACLVALAGPRRARLAALVVLPLLIAGQSAQFVHRVLPGDRVSDFYPTTAAHRFLKANVGEDRYDSSQLALYPATSLYYGIRVATGHTFTDRQWSALLRKADPKVRRSATFSAFSRLVNPQNVGNSPVLDRMGVKYFAFAAPAIDGTLPLPTPTTGTLTVPAGQEVSCSVAGGPLRGIQLTLAQPLVPASPTGGVTVHATVRAGDTTIDAGRFTGGTMAAGRTLQIAVAGESLPAGPAQVALSVTGARSPLVLTGAASDACLPIHPVSDGLRLVYADPAITIYQRLTALPRVRFATKAEVITDKAQQVDAVAAGVDPDTVVLGRQPDNTSASTSGDTSSGTTSVDVRSDDGDAIDVRVDAARSGYLTVADSMQARGWRVTIDGKRATLLPADAAMVAVAVPAGPHDVRFAYSTPHQKAGAAITVLGLLGTAALFWWDRRRRRRGDPAPAGDEP